MRNEAETRAELIDPALRAAGWGVAPGSRVLREFRITEGRLLGAARRADAEIADYVLIHHSQKLAVIEAKREEVSEAEGVGQAKAYAAKMAVPFAYATNGRKLYSVAMATGEEGSAETYPTPDELWAQAYPAPNTWRDRFAEVPYEDRSGTWSVRYYQATAIERVLDAVAKGRDRILLTLATGTGKTPISFQIAWKLFQAKWNLTGEPTRRPRILFLADRNLLANQAYSAFSSFADDARTRIKPEEIRKTGRVPTNASVFFTIFQTFMSGRGADGQPAPYFGQYPPNFFDFIIVDECHRGGANDESSWRGILEYFAPAVQLGLTATPRRRDNVDTYAYFGEPVYTYSLREGINDGFLTPFKVVQISTTLDEYVYTPDDTIVEGEVDEGHRYTEREFNRVIEIREREQYRVERLMNRLDPREKTLIFCASQAHAAAVRDLVNQQKSNPDPFYCCRVTANDGALGEQHLRAFQDSEKSIPTILTTSQKLSTGVDARNVRNIALLRTVGNMIEFKQIIGRGTRLFDGKEFFTVYDFVGAHRHFNDPEWDGEPLEPEAAPESAAEARPAAEPRERPDEAEDGSDRERRECVVIRLADGKVRELQHMSATSFWSPDGRMLSATQFLEALYGVLPDFFKDEDELRTIWRAPETRRTLLKNLESRSFDRSRLAELQRALAAEDSDLYDVLAYIAFALPRLTRTERVEKARPLLAATSPEKQRAFLEFVLAHYVEEGFETLDSGELSKLLGLRYGAVQDGLRELGPAPELSRIFSEFQQYLY